jgi:hypothetical protein
VAGVVQVEQLGYGEDHQPESDHGRADGENNLACLPVMRVSRLPAPDAECLSKDSDKENCAAENECEPCHGRSFYSFLMTFEKTLEQDFYGFPSGKLFCTP